MFIYHFYLKLDTDRNKILNWCKLNFGPTNNDLSAVISTCERWFYRAGFWKGRYTGEPTNPGGTIYIMNEDDALLFELTWKEYVHRN